MPFSRLQPIPSSSLGLTKTQAKSRKYNERLLLLTHLLQTFDAQNHQNDPQYVQLWIIYASLQPDPLSICLSLLDRNIGTTDANLYQTIANHYIHHSEPEKALSILVHAIKRGAQPAQAIRHQYEALLANIQLSAVTNDITTEARSEWINHCLLPRGKCSVDNLFSAIIMCMVHGPPEGLLELGSNSLESLLNACDCLESQIRLCGRVARLKECVGRGEDISLEELRSMSMAKSRSNWPTHKFIHRSMEKFDPVLCHQKLNLVSGKSQLESHQTQISSAVLHLPVLKHPDIDRFLQDHRHFHDLSCQPTPKIGALKTNSKSLRRHLLPPPPILGKTRTRTRETQQSVPVIRLQSDYQVINVLGKGGMGTVYKVKQIHTNKTYALKVQSPAHPLEFYILQQLAQRLNRPADHLITTAHNAWVYNSTSFMLLTHLDGGTLLDCLNITRTQTDLNTYTSTSTNTGRGTNQPAMPEPMALLLSMNLLDAVWETHQTGIIHGDLKLDNVLMDWQPDIPTSTTVYHPRHPWWHPIRLIDFGRSLDTTLWPKSSNLKCLASWSPQPHDMPDINTKPWSPRAIDYWAVASMAHLLLFGQPLRTLELRQPIRRYWHTTLWRSFFDVLLKPVAAQSPTQPEVNRDYDQDNNQAVQKVIQDIQNCLITESQKDPRLFKLRIGLQQSLQQYLKTQNLK
ncbi:hypothetical protein PHYBLDRAFT_165929 [Phycomyces blakesleeanus NRRL 1555(-)]|uniref:Protein kinase domain-containing protein n=1 Tax=Phycomyces blakesleeanus (strain ATCC 8743b / DSM 1359 / FGSC 10004 / NBRC 33097 / NRRL 1555) TaxID=763407 RepID=A0A167NI31_PHYB8|nr:hypothetical protein PHYBLDRAFT_165929 [Phycomyces blakesleeanus NRRL 1555(-)]OAD75954.1 hypothetical protein PHYBLDRAFT_165929 [Phycomyces blakesleeanus NRRL 1555(-)]|eukprot:XP_018293994.1 hypothetical protein PHYBLDRAFT_165929 [Phycomyces blakesleeanus NRRL 1555(-)]